MLKLITNRLLTAIPLVLLGSLIIFLLGELVPGDPARTILGAAATPESVAALRGQLGLDQVWYVPYGRWLAGLLHGDLGTSLYTGEQVTSALGSRLGVTLSIVSLCLVFSAVGGVGFGLVSALRGGVLGRVLDIVSLVGLALPSFWVAIILVSVFAVRLRLLPATGYVNLAESPGGWFASLVLPVTALGLLGLASVAKQTRDCALEVLEQDFVHVLRANGLPESRLVLRHVLRNAAIPVVSVLGVVAVGMLDATVFVENVFVLPGLGTRATQATIDHDISVILGVGLYFTILVVIINLLVDVLYGLLNPKVRTS